MRKNFSYNYDIQDSLLPLALVTVDNSRQEKISCMLDSGSQCCFILDSLARNLKLQTLKLEMNLKIKGFVSEQQMKVRMVRFPFIFDGKKREVDCVCLKSINIKFSTPSIYRLIDLMNNHGVDLQYEPFYQSKNNCVDNIQCLIGSCNWDIVNNLDSRVFGNEEKRQNTFYIADNKIIPVGPVERFIRDFPKHFEMRKRPVETSTITISSNVLQLDELIKCERNDHDNVTNYNYETDQNKPKLENVPKIDNCSNVHHVPYVDRCNVGSMLTTKSNVIPNKFILTSDSDLSRDTSISHYSANVVNNDAAYDNYYRGINSINDSTDINDILDIAHYVELNQRCNNIFDLDQSIAVDEQMISEGEVTDFILSNHRKTSEGHHILPIPWLNRVKPLLRSNENLARSVLRSVQKKISVF